VAAARLLESVDRHGLGGARAGRLLLSHPAGESTDDGRQVLDGYRGTVVVDGFAVYEVLARDGPGFALAHVGRIRNGNTTRCRALAGGLCRDPRIDW
jgi:hypothetical protein